MKGFKTEYSDELEMLVPSGLCANCENIFKGCKECEDFSNFKQQKYVENEGLNKKKTL